MYEGLQGIESLLWELFEGRVRELGTLRREL